MASSAMEQAKIKELLEGPGLKPPPGVIPNFIDPANKEETLIAVVSLCLIAATLCVAVRAYTRFVILRDHGWEDYTCFAAFLGLITYVSLLFSPIFREHAGIHQWNIRGKDLQSLTKIINAVEITYIPAIFLAKLSILLLYLRLFVPSGRPRVWWVTQAVIIFNALFYIANLPIEIWPCVPRSKLWNPLEEGHCINNEAVFVAGGTINMISDFMIILIPIVTVWRLKMSLRRRIGVSAIFATGIFCCLASIMHLATSVPAARSEDEVYYLFPVALWTLAEIASAIVCSCLILMPNFFRHVLPKLSSTFSSITNRGKHSSGHSKSKSNASSATAVSRRAVSFIPKTAAWVSHSSSSPPKSGIKSSTDSEEALKSCDLEMGESRFWDDSATLAPVRAEGRVSADTEGVARPISYLPPHVAVAGAGVKKEAKTARLTTPVPKGEEDLGTAGIRVDREWRISR